MKRWWFSKPSEDCAAERFHLLQKGGGGGGMEEEEDNALVSGESFLERKREFNEQENEN